MNEAVELIPFEKYLLKNRLILKENEELEVEEIKPWQKTRKEKPLSTFINER